MFRRFTEGLPVVCLYESLIDGQAQDKSCLRLEEVDIPFDVKYARYVRPNLVAVGKELYTLTEEGTPEMHEIPPLPKTEDSDSIERCVENIYGAWQKAHQFIVTGSTLYSIGEPVNCVGTVTMDKWDIATETSTEVSLDNGPQSPVEVLMKFQGQVLALCYTGDMYLLDTDTEQWTQLPSRPLFPVAPRDLFDPVPSPLVYLDADALVYVGVFTGKREVPPCQRFTMEGGWVGIPCPCGTQDTYTLSGPGPIPFGNYYTLMFAHTDKRTTPEGRREHLFLSLIDRVTGEWQQLVSTDFMCKHCCQLTETSYLVDIVRPSDDYTRWDRGNYILHIDLERVRELGLDIGYEELGGVSMS
ncbi:hypothetical protein KIPB_002719 [Kipferlia bialata]|uniref:Uncharacterized protein n=1 Tax=Kipferlia bialata TaxID=797122 RepID=A0A9K3CTA7_9EUKA|nr:hypothetical protein KIPB_002719 [Kipferlia bialata]|eukprot:g2719.t1